MAAFVVFLLTAPAAFVAGWVLRGFRDRHKGMLMNAKTRNQLTRFFDWLADARKLAAAAVVVGLLAGSSIIYTWTADQQSEDRTDEVMACIARYVAKQSEAQAPRTLASNRASDARRDWDRGYSAEVPDATVPELKARYLELYEASVRVRQTNPLPQFDRQFCESTR